MNMNRIWRWMLPIVALVKLTACVSLPSSTPFKPHAHALLEPDYFTVEVPSFDGTRIRATVYQPALGPDETAPVVIHAHGFGFFRMSRPMSLYGQFLFTGKASLEAWRQGYWVVSFDQRGHGASDGKIHVLDEAYELKDLVYLIDWIETNIPRISYKDGDPLIGMIGESYGGGTQLLGSGLDSRIDAIVPVTTWNDFNESLAPQAVPKTGWLTTLFLSSNVLNPGNMQSELNESYQISRSGVVPAKLAKFLDKRSVSQRCSQNGSNFRPGADALFIQGFRDVLFPVNEAVNNADCLKAHGRDVRIVATQDGHLLPFTQLSRGVPGHRIEKYVHCGAHKLKTVDLAVAWFDEKLKGISGAADNIPPVCLTHDYETGSIFTKVPQGGIRYQVPETHVKTGMAGLYEFPMKMLDRFTSLFTFKNNDRDRPLSDDKRGGTFRPAFVPLHRVDSATMLAGIPQARFKLDSARTNEPRVFVGLGLKRAGSQTIELISEQVLPIRGRGDHQVDLPAMSTRLEPSDVIGLVVSSYSNQFRLSGSGFFGNQAQISGTIDIPLLGTHGAKDQYLVQAFTQPLQKNSGAMH